METRNRATITFAFVRHPTADVYCEGARQQAENASSRAAAAVEEPCGNENGSLATSAGVHGGEAATQTLFATVHCVSFAGQTAQTYSFSCEVGDTMAKVYRALATKAYDGGEPFLCYVPTRSCCGQVLRPCVERVLYLDDAIPEKLVSQQLALPVPLTHPASLGAAPALVVNVLILSEKNECHIGHLPLVAGLQAKETPQDIRDALSRLLRLTDAERAFVSQLPLTSCQVKGGGITVTGGDGGLPKDRGGQLALVFPDMEVGEVVRVDVHRANPDGECVSAQGTVARHRDEHGVRSYDVLCLDGATSVAHELRGLSCFQVIPL